MVGIYRDMSVWNDPFRVVRHDQQYLDDNGVPYPPDFFGRGKNLSEVFNRLSWRDSRPPIIIQGEWRMGKTSLLKLIEIKLKGNDTFLPLWLSFGTAALRTVTEVVSKMQHELSRATGCAAPSLTPSYGNPGARDALFELHQMVKQCAPEKRLVFIIDDWDNCIEADGMPDDQRSKILGLFKDVVNSELPVYFVFSVNRIRERFSYTVQTFLSECIPVPLEPFDNDQDYAAMVRGLFEDANLITAGDIASFYRQSGGWPFYTKAIRQYVTDQLLASLQLQQSVAQAAKTAAHDTQGRLNDNMAPIFHKHFGEDEKRIVVRLATSGGSIPKTHLAEQSVDLQRPGSLETAADQLVKRHYARNINDAFAFRIPFLIEWMQHRPQWAELCHRWGGATGDRQRRFRVALSYASERRSLVGKVAERLIQRLPRQVLYDQVPELQAEFARGDLGTYLPNLYHKESDLIVVFICEHYAVKQWCNWEREAILSLRHSRPDALMFFRFDATELPALYSDGGIYIKDRESPEIVELILNRLKFLDIGAAD
jgi:hypothetical protein